MLTPESKNPFDDFIQEMTNQHKLDDLSSLSPSLSPVCFGELAYTTLEDYHKSQTLAPLPEHLVMVNTVIRHLCIHNPALAIPNMFKLGRLYEQWLNSLSPSKGERVGEG